MATHRFNINILRGLNSALLTQMINTIVPPGAKGDKGDTGAKGDKGDPGASLTWRGAWSSGTNYVVLDVVTYQGSSWRAISASTNQAPQEGVYWTIVAQKGNTGATGPAGADGEDGAPGNDGADGVGVPAGGIAGQLVAKTESATEWVEGVLSTVLTGMSLSTNSPVTTSDNVLQGIGKLQAQISALTTNAKTDSYTLALSDAGKLVEISKATAVTLTIPTNASVAFPVGTKIDILQTGAGQVTIAGAGVTINAQPGLKLSAQWAAATLVKRATDTWVVIGSLSA